MSFRAPLLLSLALAALGCGSSASTSTSVTAPGSSRCEASVSSSATTYAAAGGTGTLNVAVERECAWRATTSVNWITFTSSTDGQGDGSVAFRVAENADPVTRQATLALAERQVSLTQQGAPCEFEVGGVPSTMGSQGGQAQIELRTHAACSWTASGGAPWATVAPASGRGDAQLTLTVATNTGSQPRSTTLLIADERPTLSQAAVPTPSPAPTPTPPPPQPSPQPPPPPGSPEPTPTPTPPPPPPPPTDPTDPTDPGPTPPPPQPPPGPAPGDEVQLSGVIGSLTGTCPSVQFVVAGRVVVTTENTVHETRSCPSMRDGLAVEIQGTLLENGSVRADRIRYVGGW